MGVQRLQLKGLFKPGAYTQVVVASGRRTVFISGQVSMDADGKLVAPGDFAGQARQVFENLRTALEGAGAKPADVVKLTTDIVGYKPELPPCWPTRAPPSSAQRRPRGWSGCRRWLSRAT